VESGGSYYCCALCAHEEGIEAVLDRS